MLFLFLFRYPDILQIPRLPLHLIPLLLLAHGLLFLLLLPLPPHLLLLLLVLCALFTQLLSLPPVSLSSPLLTWNPSSLKTIHQTPSRKMNHILKLSHKHICFLQETQWNSVQYNHLLLQSTFCTSSSGVAILLPKTLTPSASLIIAPGYILSVSISVGGITVELINVYLHPEHVGGLAKTLLKHLRTDTTALFPRTTSSSPPFTSLLSGIPAMVMKLTSLDSLPPPLTSLALSPLRLMWKRGQLGSTLAKLLPYPRSGRLPSS